MPSVATTNSTLQPSAVAGWTAAALVTTKPYAYVTVAGAAVLYEATCEFTNSQSGATEKVTLIGGKTATKPETVLQRGGNGTLVDGQSDKSATGNQLTVVASGPLVTA